MEQTERSETLVYKSQTPENCPEKKAYNIQNTQRKFEIKNNQNLYVAYSDYRKTFDSVPHSWLTHVLQMYKTDPQIINSLQQLMKNWTTALQVKVKNRRIMSDPIRIQRGIYQGDSLSPIWFCLALNPLSYLLNRTNYGFGVHCGNKEIQGLNHLLYMDDINLSTPELFF